MREEKLKMELMKISKLLIAKNIKIMVESRK